MDEQIDISGLKFFLINGPLVLFTLAVNFFFLFCLANPLGNSQRLKQPLKTILEYIMWCSILYVVFLTLNFTLDAYLTMTASFVLWLMMQHFVHNSMSAYVWLNFYFFIHIVPPRGAPLIWLKRNIKVATFIAALLDLVILFNNSAVGIAVLLYDGPAGLPNANDTVIWNPIRFTYPIFLLSQIRFIVTWVYMWTVLCFMIVVSCITFRYLQGHMRSVAKNGIAFPSARLRAHLWVTVTGISQCVMFCFCASYYFFDSFTLLFSLNFYMGPHFSYTISTVYVFSTTVNLSLGQSMFRQRAMTLWRALKSMCGVDTETNDLIVCSSGT
ncbi:taste receptor, type 2, member 201, tandem duplicate 1 [Hippocampus comes]|uniref:taste receptor, type 2, member 201, tandem duplicate 1 n=1 Tax=Hippocampus comes TaxID=109280 RepID=UPI00094F2B09|nr:PREDICTED: uncharacterized protein LOC109531297 [Hippocampus comes]